MKSTPVAHNYYNRLNIVQPVIFLLLFSLFSISDFAQTKDGYHVLVGTYTKGKSKGIEVYSYNVKTGKLTFENETPVSNPSYLCLSPDNRFVYAVSEEDGKDGSVSAFSFNAHSGKLAFLNKFSSEGIAPCYISTDHTGKLVFVANYTSGTIAAFHTSADGLLIEKPQVIVNSGSSLNKERQEHAHAHSVVVSPDNKYLFTADLGTDKEMVYTINLQEKTSPLKPSAPAFYKEPAGSGPRHLVFSNDARFAYLIHELSGTITTFRFAAGKFKTIQTTSLVPAGPALKVGAADIHLSADGKFIYGSDRGDYNDIAAFSVNKQSGLISYKSRISSFGKTPRNFALSPDGRFLLVGNQNSDDAYVLPRNTVTGKLSPYSQKLEIGSPVCVKFVKIK